jgi:O-methyltransferase
MIKSIINKLGFDIIRKKVNQYSNDRCSETESNKMIEIIRNNTMVAHEGLFSLYHQALFCEEHELVGDFVECGVWKGGAVGLMALVNLTHGSTRRHLHLFDSFEEICEPDEEIDGHRAVSEVKLWAKNGGTKGRLVPLKGIYDHRGGPGTIQENEFLLTHTVGYDPQYIHFHKGWFQHTLPEQHFEIDKIAILRIDADWYASTKICLDYLFDKVTSGGFVIIDDYGAYDGCRKAVDEYIKSKEKPLFLNYVNTDIRYIIAP